METKPTCSFVRVNTSCELRWRSHEYYIGKHHDEGANYMCVDGHVEYDKFDDLVDDWNDTRRIFSPAE